jgi:hypothetical protein
MIKENTIIKKDSSENWAKAKNFVPKEGEIIFYDEDKIKIGDGLTKVNDLPFVNENSYEYHLEGTTLVIQSKGG